MNVKEFFVFLCLRTTLAAANGAQLVLEALGRMLLLSNVLARRLQAHPSPAILEPLPGGPLRDVVAATRDVQHSGVGREADDLVYG